MMPDRNVYKCSHLTQKKYFDYRGTWERKYFPIGKKPFRVISGKVDHGLFYSRELEKYADIGSLAAWDLMSTIRPGLWNFDKFPFQVIHKSVAMKHWTN